MKMLGFVKCFSWTSWDDHMVLFFILPCRILGWLVFMCSTPYPSYVHNSVSHSLQPVLITCYPVRRVSRTVSSIPHSFSPATLACPHVFTSNFFCKLDCRQWCFLPWCGNVLILPQFLTIASQDIKSWTFYFFSLTILIPPAAWWPLFLWWEISANCIVPKHDASHLSCCF